MGTIVYGNLCELLLEEGDKTKEKIINEAINRFGFPDNSRLSFGIELQLSIGEKTGFFSKEESKYSLLRYNNISGRRNFLEILNRANENYFKERPWIKKLKIALEEAGLQK
ncbi:hypothetical protein ES703_07774 [subsurface metagenome]